MDYATRNYDGAARNLERLRGDFPASPLMAHAAYWAARTYFDSNNPQAACRWLADGMAKAQTDVELQNQLGYLYQRCDLRSDSTTAQAPRPAGVAGAPGAAGPTSATGPIGAAGAPAPGDSGARDSTRIAASPPPNAAPSAAPSPVASPGAPTPSNPAPSASPAPAPSPPATTPAASPSTGATAPAPPPGTKAAARPVYRVQIAAVGSRKAAEDAARKARPLGLTVVTVQQGNLYKVRVGEYPTREAAQTAAASLKAKLGGTPFVVSEP
jgi:cell division septation protein DedD